jgi:23S rRNA pseudouridine2605 synthase
MVLTHSHKLAQSALATPFLLGYSHRMTDENELKQGDRIAKLLARAGVASRRDVEQMILDGRVARNGEVLTGPAVILKNLAGVTVDGQAVPEPDATRVFRFYKPTGCVTSNTDAHDRPTIFDLLPDTLPRVVTVGRLDYNTEGLLLLTNDGALARHLELPANKYVRRYRVRVFGSITQRQLDKLSGGITIDDVRYGPINARLETAKTDKKTGSANQWMTIELQEGKNREVRRVCAHLGLRVTRLIRTSFGAIESKGLEPGDVDELSSLDIDRLRRAPKPETVPEIEVRKPQRKDRDVALDPRADTSAAKSDERSPRRTFSDRPKRDFADRPARRNGEERRPFKRAQRDDDAPRRTFSDRPKRDFADRPAHRNGEEHRPFKRVQRDDDAPRRTFSDRPKRDFADRPARKDNGDGPRKTYQRRDDKNTHGASADRPKRRGPQRGKAFYEREGQTDRTQRKPVKRSDSDSRPARGFSDRPARKRSEGGKPFARKPTGGRPKGPPRRPR